MQHQKIIWYGMGVFIIESIVMGSWFYVTKPESDIALNILSIVLVLLGINLILGLLFYFFLRSLAALFLANAIICPLIFYAIWIMWFMFYAQYPS